MSEAVSTASRPTRHPTVVKSRRWSAKKKRDFWWGMCFCSPAIIGLLWFTAYPVLVSLYYSFTSYTMVGGNTHWLGLTNYRDLWSDQNWLDSLYNTGYLMIFMVPLGILLALILALLLNMNVRFQSIYRTIFYLPTIVPFVAAAVVWYYIFDPQFGAMNDILSKLGLSAPGWLASPAWTKPALIILSMWGAGNLMIILLAGLQDVPVDLHDAARVDGANFLSRFRHITLPFLSPHLLFGLIIGLIGMFQYFAPPYVLFGGTSGPAASGLVSSLYLYQNAFVYFRVGYASAMAWMLFIFIAIITALVFRFIGRRVYYAGGE
jgi:multiple sugar transport system permease protein